MKRSQFQLERHTHTFTSSVRLAQSVSTGTSQSDKVSEFRALEVGIIKIKSCNKAVEKKFICVMRVPGECENFSLFLGVCVSSLWD